MFSAATNAILGSAFLVLAFATVFLMYHLWGYPFDKATHTSAAPKGLMRLHRVLGLVYGIIYIVLMTQMLPRLWTYQVEFPARTVAHIALGFVIGTLLLVKLFILRFARHFEEWMPSIGTSLLLCTVLLTGLSIPFSFKEQTLASARGDFTSPANLERLKTLLPTANFAPEIRLETLATPAALNAGRQVLLGDCVICHDLRTVLLRPRTPADWQQTVWRMLEKPNPSGEITLSEAANVTAYLIAITPDLQQSAQAKREQGVATSATSSQNHKALFEQSCAGCHSLDLATQYTYSSKDSVTEIVQRMVANGMGLSQTDLKNIVSYMQENFVK
jgi:mono/diheme cytochrome c family protein